MNMMYRWMQEETARLRNENQELLEFINVIQVSLSHLIQDGEGNDAIKNLLSLTEEIQVKYGNKT